MTGANEWDKMITKEVAQRLEDSIKTVEVDHSYDTVGAVNEPIKNIHPELDKLWEDSVKHDGEEADEFFDISDEEYRWYIFDNERDVMIINPVELRVCEHAHTIIDEEGVWHTIPYGWIEIQREMRDHA